VLSDSISEPAMNYMLLQYLAGILIIEFTTYP